ncbi:MAG TPA: glycine cleavage system aminomethyltransferase GcvT [Candidatus Eisenbacteria bacterium]|jgi:aminomethyltransferase
MLDTSAGLRRTPFHDRHIALGAKMVPFAGHMMPLSYEGIVAEHRAVREGVGVFDVSHMGEIRLRGPGAVPYANHLVTNEVGAIPDGKAVYTPMCLEHGGIVDDLLVYAEGADRLLVVNASNFAKDLAWVREHAPRDVQVVDEHEATAQLAVQGPNAEAVVAAVYGDRVRGLEFYTSFRCDAGADRALISRTGYTGEDGFEIYVPADRALAHWDRVLEAGRAAGIRPIGLGARDTLRLEMGYCLYGNDIDETTNPLEAGIGWTVRWDKTEFLGHEALRRVKAEGTRRRLVGLVLEADRIARPGAELYVGEKRAGTVTSGSMGISLGKPVAMAYAEADGAPVGTRVTLRARGQSLPARVTPRPMWTRGSVRSPKPRRTT